MGYRFYTSREFARLARIKEREELERRADLPIYMRMATPIQTELASLIHLVPADRQQVARMFMKLRNASPKQLAACQRWVERARGA